MLSRQSKVEPLFNEIKEEIYLGGAEMYYLPYRIDVKHLLAVIRRPWYVYEMESQNVLLMHEGK